MSLIKFDYTSNLMLVNVFLWNQRQAKFENMLITFDTGASNTVISKDILYMLGYNLGSGEKTRIVTASGVEYVEPMVMDKLRIGSHILEDVQIYAHTFPESSFSLGVLGLNVISQFDIQMKFSTKELVLDKLIHL